MRGLEAPALQRRDDRRVERGIQPGDHADRLDLAVGADGQARLELALDPFGLRLRVNGVVDRGRLHLDLGLGRLFGARLLASLFLAVRCVRFSRQRRGHFHGRGRRRAFGGRPSQADARARRPWRCSTWPGSWPPAPPPIRGAGADDGAALATGAALASAGCTIGLGGGAAVWRLAFFFSSVTATGWRAGAAHGSARPRQGLPPRRRASPRRDDGGQPHRLLAGLLNVDRELGDARQLREIQHVNDVAVHDLFVRADDQAHLRSPRRPPP